MTAAVTSQDLDTVALRGVIDDVLADFLAEQQRSAVAWRLPSEVAQVLSDFVGGGKRIRPVLCAVGWHAGGRGGLPPTVARVGAALEMFHAFALIHDDVMDRSERRRGRSTVHRVLGELHRAGRDEAAVERLGISAAILAGDLALSWSDQLLHGAGLAPGRLAAVLSLVDEMRTELMYGQYLDITSTGRPTADVERALRIARYKTAYYTLRWPLLIGATLAGSPQPVHDALAAYAQPLGELFQLRDDLLGVFGRPDETGKSCLDDLREGKHTVLVALALQRADEAQQRTLHTLLGRPDLAEDDATRIRRMIVATGAREAVEHLIQTRRHQALDAVDHGPFPPIAAAALRQLAHTITVRTA
ncbi:hypothetical protein T261_7017 [Streptomyces lydicus]|nr:hypothetical protein T261_7017 [Streptomyces lydicus]